MFDEEKGLCLSKPAQRGGSRGFHVFRDGSSLVTRTSVGSKPPTEARKDYASPEEATREYHKAARAKFRDGYALLRDRASAPRGAVVFAGFASGGGGGPLIDLSPDGRRALTAGHNGAPKSVWIEVIDLATGARTTVFERSHPSQIFLHAARFERDGGRILAAVGDETLRIPLHGGPVDSVATYVAPTTRRPFNPHVLRPLLSADRSRAVLFDKDETIRVVDERFSALMEVKTAHKTTECGAAGISPSGKLLAVYRVSRGIMYGHDDAKNDATIEIDIWDIDGAKKLDTIPVDRMIDKLGFNPTDELLLTTQYYARGPVAYDLKTKKEAFRFDEDSGGELATAHDWRYSLDGAWMAVASQTTKVYEAASRAPVEIEPFGYDARQVVFADGLLAALEGSLCVVRSMA